MAGIGFKVVVGMMANSLTPNLKRALNAARCMVNAMGNNTWTLIAAAYFAARQFGMDGMLTGYLDMGYEMVCTCGKDVEGMTGMLVQFNMYPTPEEVAEFFGTCSEQTREL